MIVTVEEVRHHLRIDNDEEDCLLENIVEQVTASAENYCRVKFGEMDPFEVPKTVKLAVLLMTGHFYEYRDNPDSESYKAARMAFENLLYPERDPEKLF